MGDGDGSWDFGDKSLRMGVGGIRVGRWEFVGPCFGRWGMGDGSWGIGVCWSY